LATNGIECDDLRKGCDSEKRRLSVQVVGIGVQSNQLGDGKAVRPLHPENLSELLEVLDRCLSDCED